MKRTIAIFISFFFLTLVIAQSTLFEQLPENEIYKVQIEADLKKLIKEKMDPIYQEGKFTFLSGPLNGQSFEVEIRARGNIRKEICYYPPVKLKFKKSEFKHHKIKWVNICRETEPMREVLLKEYLTYQLYQKLTDQSLGVRLFEVEYLDKDGDKSMLSSYGFMIEPIKELAERTGAKEYEPRIMRPRILDRHYYPLVSMFQYLVGNTDWAIDNLHNLKFLRNSNYTGIIPVPYDFDYSGFVNAYYAVPHESLPIKHVRDRYNKGHCLSTDELQEVRELVLSKKEEMLNLIASFDHLPERSKNKLVSFMEQGFDDLENDKACKRIFLKNCDMCPVD